MPPMPPPPAGMPLAAFFFGSSATMASVVIRSAATEAAFWIATRTTLAGSMMPLETRLPYSRVCASKPQPYCSFSRTLPTTTEPSSPALIAIWRAGQDRALRTISTPVFWSSFLVRMPLRFLGGTEQGDAAARQDAFLDSRAGCMHRVINAVLAFLHLDLGRAADADHRDAARELGETLLQLLTVVVRGGLLPTMVLLLQGNLRF